MELDLGPPCNEEHIPCTVEIGVPLSSVSLYQYLMLDISPERELQSVIYCWGLPSPVPPPPLPHIVSLEGPKLTC